MGNRLLITKNGALGDVIVSTAAMYELCECRDFDEVQICGPLVLTELLSPSLWKKVTAIWVIDDKYHRVSEYLPSGSIWKKSGKVLAYFSLVGEFETIANLRYESGRFIWPAFFRRLKNRIGSAPFFSSFLYTYRAPWLGLEPLMHERDRHLQVISAYPTLRESLSRWQGRGLPQLQERNESVLSKYGLKPGKYILINPTASQRYKAWEASRFHELIHLLLPDLEKMELELVVIGSPSETAWLEEVQREGQLVVQPSHLRDLVQIVAHSRLLVANASSMHFIASSFGVPVFVIMGAAKPEIWGPLGSQSSFIKGKPGPGSPRRNEISAFASLSVDQVYRELLSKFIKVT
jgi:ADP-heptose:LPS heptosyltransferase